MALFFSLLAAGAHASLPLTETIYIIPENEVELSLREQVVDVERYYRRDRIGAGLGILPSVSLWIEFTYCTQDVIPGGKSEIGDLFLTSKFYIGDYWASRLHSCFLLRIRIPTGQSAYSSEEWRNLSLGKNEMTIGPIFQLDFLDPLFIHFNLLYTFREGEGEDFYGGFYLNIFKGETWQKLFGLNPWGEDTFLETGRLINDYISLSIAVNTDIIYPVVPFFECYTSFRVSGSAGSLDDLPIEALGINPVLLLSAGARYFFTESVYGGMYCIVNPLWQKDFIKIIYGMELSFQF